MSVNIRNGEPICAPTHFTVAQHPGPLFVTFQNEDISPD